MAQLTSSAVNRPALGAGRCFALAPRRLWLPATRTAAPPGATLHAGPQLAMAPTAQALRGLHKDQQKLDDRLQPLIREHSPKARPDRGGNVDPLEGVGPAKLEVTVNRGTFDISIEPPAANGPGKSAQKHQSGQMSSSVRPQPAPSAGVVESLLVSGHAAAPADQARVEGGAVVLSASLNANGNNGNGNAGTGNNGNGNGGTDSNANAGYNGNAGDGNNGNGNGNAGDGNNGNDPPPIRVPGMATRRWEQWQRPADGPGCRERQRWRWEQWQRPADGPGCRERQRGDGNNGNGPRRTRETGTGMATPETAITEMARRRIQATVMPGTAITAMAMTGRPAIRARWATAIPAVAITATATTATTGMPAAGTRRLRPASATASASAAGRLPGRRKSVQRQQRQRQRRQQWQAGGGTPTAAAASASHRRRAIVRA